MALENIALQILARKAASAAALGTASAVAADITHNRKEKKPNNVRVQQGAVSALAGTATEVGLMVVAPEAGMLTKLGVGLGVGQVATSLAGGSPSGDMLTFIKDELSKLWN